ncbi:hypothetical protein PCK1_003111 [Pneumocystis canis]|nr:hypothetical protein PCK1_003111 [Pneumocystis canis]
MDKEEIILDFSNEINNFKENLLNMTFNCKKTFFFQEKNSLFKDTDLQNKKLQKLSEYCIEYQKTINYQRKIIQYLLKERHKEIQKIHEYQNYSENIQHHNSPFENENSEKNNNENKSSDYITYIKNSYEKTSQYDALLFFFEKYDKMKHSLLCLSKKYRKEKKIWKEYISYKINKKSENLPSLKHQDKTIKRKERFSDKENALHLFPSSTINRTNSNSSKVSLKNSEPLELIDSSELNIDLSLSVSSESPERCILSNQKHTPHITQYLCNNDSTTEDENETVKSCHSDSKSKGTLVNDPEIDEEVLSKPFLLNSNSEIEGNNLSSIRRNCGKSLESCFLKKSEISQNTGKSSQEMTPESESIYKKNMVSDISNFLPTPQTSSKSVLKNNNSYCEDEETDENLSFKIVPASETFQSFSPFNIAQSLINKENCIPEIKGELNNINNLTSTLLKKDPLTQVNPFMKKEESSKDNIVTKKDVLNIKVDSKSQPLTEYENEKLCKNLKSASNLNFNNKGLGRYSRALKHTKESLNDYVINLDKNDNIPYAYNEVVRNKTLRKHLPACACENCIKFFEAHGPIATIPKPIWRSSSKDKIFLDSTKEHIYKNLQQVSRHRAAFFRAKTPPGFWESDFPNTQQEQNYRKQAEIQNYERLKERKFEAERGGRWKKRT